MNHPESWQRCSSASYFIYQLNPDGTNRWSIDITRGYAQQPRQGRAVKTSDAEMERVTRTVLAADEMAALLRKIQGMSIVPCLGWDPDITLPDSVAGAIRNLLKKIDEPLKTP